MQLQNTHLAIKKKQSLIHISFKNSRPGVKKMGVVITDGKSSEPQLTEWEAKLAHDDGIDVFAIGIQCLIYNISTIIWYIYGTKKEMNS